MDFEALYETHVAMFKHAVTETQKRHQELTRLHFGGPWVLTIFYSF